MWGGGGGGGGGGALKPVSAGCAWSVQQGEKNK